MEWYTRASEFRPQQVTVESTQEISFSPFAKELDPLDEGCDMWSVFFLFFFVFFVFLLTVWHEKLRPECVKFQSVSLFLYLSHSIL